MEFHVAVAAMPAFRFAVPAWPGGAGHVAREPERRLAPIFGEAERNVRQDAADNACILLRNGLRLATGHVRQGRGGRARRPGEGMGTPDAKKRGLYGPAGRDGYCSMSRRLRRRRRISCWVASVSFSCFAAKISWA